MRLFSIVPAALFVLFLAMPVGANYTFRDGYWWKDKVAYNRSVVYRSGVPCYSYTRAKVAAAGSATASVNINASTADWRTKLLEIAGAQAEQGYFLEAVSALGLGNGYGAQARSNYQLSSAGVNGSTVYGYNGFNATAFYGDLNLNQLYQAASLQAEQAQGNASQAVAGHANLVARAGANHARVAAILADSQAFSARMQALKEQSAYSNSYGTAPAPPPVPQPPADPGLPGQPLTPDADDGDDRETAAPRPGTLRHLVSTECLTCHGDKKQEGKLDLRDMSRLTDSQWANILTRVFTPDMNKVMPRTLDGKPHPLSALQRQLFLFRPQPKGVRR